jgi:peptide/nickel transport system permease protein
MLTFIIHRTLYGAMLLFFASVVIFYGLRVAPGSITDVLTNPLNREALAPVLSSQLGLDKPLPEQYFVFAKHLLTGQLGVSMVSGQPISRLIGRAIGQTLLLAGAAAFLTYILAIPLGVLAAWKRNTIIDQGAMLFAVLGMGIPNFFLAVLLIHFFSVQHRWLPVAGSGDLRHLILPAVVLAAEAIAINLRVVRSSMLEELSKDYVRTLHAKGISNFKIIWVHVLRNALPPVIALAGIMLRTLLGYTLIVEVIFRWPGLGSQLVNSVLKRDYTVAQTLAIMLTFAVIVFNLLADIGQQWADPRTRTHGSAS